MSLRAKILYALLIVVTLYAALDYGIQRFVIFPSFVSLERDEAKKDMERFVEALGREIENFNLFSNDWAAWDDTYKFVKDRNEEYINSNLLLNVFTEQHLNLLYICDMSGKVVWGQSHNLNGKEAKPVQINEFPADSLPLTHPLVGHKDVESSIAGIFMTDKGPMMVTSHPIITSESKGPIRGVLIMGRFLNEKIVEKLATQTRLTLQAWPIQEGKIPAEIKDLVNVITPDNPFLIKQIDKDNLQIYSTFSDIKGNPALVLRADIIQHITTRGYIAMGFALISILGSGLIVLVILYILLQKIVLGPVAQLSDHAIAIGRSGDLTSRLSIKRSDEIGTLAREFNKMVEELSEVRKKLMEQSYHSGMAEMASGVLHNVRNSLTPIIVEIEAMCQEIRSFPIEQIEIADKELVNADTSPERKEALSQFLRAGNKNLTCLVQNMRSRLKGIATPVSQIERILAEQDKYCHTERPLEQFRLDELIADAITLLPKDFPSIAAIEIDKSVVNLAEVKAHHISLLQVFSNLLINAVESIKQSGVSAGRINISADVEKVGDSEMIHVQVCDNGTGIEDANLQRIFERGFSTKQNKNSGFGLHWSANTMAAMNGRLYAENSKTGQGACFHILFPANP